MQMRIGYKQLLLQRQVSLLEGRMDIPELRILLKRELSCVPNMIATYQMSTPFFTQ